MTTLILDRFSQQSLLTRIFSYVFTSLGWGLWIYLWLPLLQAMFVLLTHQEVSQETSEALNSLEELFHTLSIHMLAIACVIIAFLLWAILQWLGKHNRLQAIDNQNISVSYKNLSHIEQSQVAQCVLVSHDDVTGSINRVQIVNPKNSEKLA